MFKLNKTSIIVIIVGIYTLTALIMAVLNLPYWSQDKDNSQFAKITPPILEDRPEEINYCHILKGQPCLSTTEDELLGEIEGIEKIFVKPIGVIIDNNPAAGRQYGLVQANLVMELPVEGGMTRFFVFYDPDQLIAKIGPVRSARVYFIDFARSLQAVLAHSGGSPAALAKLDTGLLNIVDIDEIGPAGRYFWRDPNRPAPHNLFTSIHLLNQAQEKLAFNWPSAEIDYQEMAWQWRQEDPAEPAEKAVNPSVKIDYSTYSYEVEYKYDEEIQRYERYQGGKADYGAEGDSIKLDNILVAFMRIQDIDKEGRLELGIAGQGRAVVCQLGSCREGEWRKPAVDQRIKFYIEEEEAALVPGKTWLNVVPVGRKVEY